MTVLLPIVGVAGVLAGVGRDWTAPEPAAGPLVVVVPSSAPPGSRGEKALRSPTIDGSASLPAEAEALPVGGQLFVKNCGACHSLQPPPKNGPPARGISRHYQDALGEKSAFVDAVVTFVNQPSKEHARMAPAVERFGLMPKLAFQEVELRQIAEWLYTVAPARGPQGGPHRDERRHRTGTPRP